MSDAKLDQVLALLSDMARRQDDMAKRQDDMARRQDDMAKRQDDMAKRQDDMAKRQDEMLVAFRSFWADMSQLYRSSREDLRQFEEHIEAKLGRVAEQIAGLKVMIETQDYHARELSQRVTRLEAGTKPPL